MAIELAKEEVLTFRDAARRLPRTNGGKTIHASAIYRWASVGLHGVRLEIIRIGGRMFTSMEALARFAARLTEADAQARSGGSEPDLASRNLDLDRRLSHRLRPRESKG